MIPKKSVSDLTVAFVGCSGHMSYALPAIRRYGARVIACAVTEGEDIGRMAASLEKSCGYAVPKMTVEEALALKPDVLVVSTIFSRSAAIAAQALGAGISVFLEKPAATDFEALDRLERVWREKSAEPDAPMLCGMFGIRYDPAFRTARRLVDRGVTGETRLMNGMKSYKLGTRPWFYADRATYGGLIPWVAIHAIDWILWLGGKKPLAVSAFQSSKCNGGNGDMEITSLMNLTLEDGVLASVTADMMRSPASPTHGDDRFRLVGTEGTLEVRQGRLWLNDAEQELDEAGDIFEDMLLALTEGRPTDNTAEALFAATRTALLARQSADEGGRLLQF